MTTTPSSLTLAIIDIDLFKQVNDQYGHDARDGVLREVAARLKACVRASDLLARLGGEEFGLVMPGMPGQVAAGLLDRLRATVESRAFVVGGRSIRCTGSVGITDGTATDVTWDSLYQRADRALYEAKARGRNQVVVA